MISWSPPRTALAVLFRRVSLLLLCLVLYTPSKFQCCEALSSSSSSSSGVRFRQGTKSDEFQIATTMARELMNPLGIDSTRFIVAVNPENSKELYGWAQLRPIGPAVVNPNEFDAGPGGGDMERDVINEEIWEDFEKDEVDVPVGFASLPWTKEYREFSKSAAKRRDKREALMAQAEKDAQRDQNQLWELASVYVIPSFRGNGVGSELVRRCMAKHAMLDRNCSSVYILTLATTKDWYESLGFSITSDPPNSMKFEIAAGKILTKAIGAELICMRYR